MKEFASQIYAAVQSKKLAEPFDADMIKRACPGWTNRTYHVFPSKHAVGNPGKNTELFVREKGRKVAPKYRNPKNRTETWADVVRCHGGLQRKSNKERSGRTLPSISRLPGRRGLRSKGLSANRNDGPPFTGISTVDR
jgi:hypothetical protein